MKVNIEKLFCLLCVCVLLAGMLPVSVLAEENTFTVALGETDEIHVDVGDSFEIPVVVGHTGDLRNYNSFDMRFTYDPSVLELTSATFSGMSVTKENGAVRVLRYGSDLAVDTAAFTLTFQAIKPGTTTIRAAEAKVGFRQTAQEVDAADALILNDVTVVIGRKFLVTFDANGGSVDMDSVFTGTDGTLAVLPTPVRENYVFKGWYTAKTGGTQITTDTVLTGDTTVYAQWGGYKIDVPATSHGTLSVSTEEAAAGETVVITVKPKSGYRLKTLTVTTASGENISVSTDNNGKYSFVMPKEDVTIKATFASRSNASADTSNPKTGDHFDLVIWNAAATVSLLVLAFLIRNKKKFCEKIMPQ